MTEIAAIVLAAGKGTRMKSELPKVLHRINGQAMIEYVLQAVTEAAVGKTVVVVGHGGEQVQATLSEVLEYVTQEQQLGTGHAVMQAEAVLGDFQGDIIVLCGDTPMISGSTLRDLVEEHKKKDNSATVLTAVVSDPAGYGRILRNEQGDVEKIVEDKDASPQELEVREINSGLYCFKSTELFEALRIISPANAQGEYYLTDVLEIVRDKGLKVGGLPVEDFHEIMGINNKLQLAEAEKIIRQAIIEKHMLNGVTVVDPDNTYINSRVTIGEDTVLFPGTIIEGNSQIGANCYIGPNARIVNSQLGDGVEVQYSVVTESKVGVNTVIGPFAYLRPGTVLGRDVKIGDFVEIKNSFIRDGSKVPHLSYVGDTDMGEKVNIGAGTITCNYDGKKKSRTVIEDGAFIGSNTNLVAPVRIGKEGMTAAGSTITKDVPEGNLGVERTKQVNYPKRATRKKC